MSKKGKAGDILRATPGGPGNMGEGLGTGRSARPAYAPAVP